MHRFSLPQHWHESITNHKRTHALPGDRPPRSVDESRRFYPMRISEQRELAFTGYSNLKPILASSDMTHIPEAGISTTEVVFPSDLSETLRIVTNGCNIPVFQSHRNTSLIVRGKVNKTNELAAAHERPISVMMNHSSLTLSYGGQMKPAHSRELVHQSISI